MDNTVQSLVGYIDQYMPLIVSAGKALVVLILGWIVAGWISRMVRRRVNAVEHIDNTLGNFAASVIRWLILLVVLIAILNLFGIQATSLVAMLGAATLAVGMALQGTLSDLASGFMLILFRPYKLEQYVDIGGTAGTVKDINLFFTELATPDNVQIIIPNGQAWGTVITNYSHHDSRRVDLVFGIDYGDDAAQAMEIVRRLAEADARVHAEPEPWLRVTNLGDSSVDITARLWVDAADYWEVKFALTKAVKEAFDAGGITIPYPHRVLVQSPA